MGLYTGFDLHSSNTYVGIIDEDGKRIWKKKLRNNPLPGPGAVRTGLRTMGRGLGTEPKVFWSAMKRKGPLEGEISGVWPRS
jgi:hypothetical protein